MESLIFYIRRKGGFFLAKENSTRNKSRMGLICLFAEPLGHFITLMKGRCWICLLIIVKRFFFKIKKFKTVSPKCCQPWFCGCLLCANFWESTG